MIGITNAGGNISTFGIRLLNDFPANPKDGDIVIYYGLGTAKGEITPWVINEDRVDQAEDGYTFIHIDSAPQQFPVTWWASLHKRNPFLGLSCYWGPVLQKKNGKYKQMTAKLYFTGEWHQISAEAPLWDGYLYKLGNNQYTDYTGGWVGGTYNSEGTLDYTASGSPDSVIRTAKAVDITNFNTLVFDGIMWGNNSGGAFGGNILVCRGADGSGVVAQKNLGSTAWGQYSLDISSVKGSYYIRFQVGGNDHSIRMRNCYLQK